MLKRSKSKIFLTLIFILMFKNSKPDSDDRVIILEGDSPDKSYVAKINSVFQDASIISIRYFSKTRTYPSDTLSLDLDKYWSFEIKSNCVSNCHVSEEWLYLFLTNSIPSSKCPTMLSTFVEFEFLDKENFRIYIDHAGHCLYAPYFQKYYFSEASFNDVIKTTWGETLRGM